MMVQLSFREVEFDTRPLFFPYLNPLPFPNNGELDTALEWASQKSQMENALSFQKKEGRFYELLKGGSRRKSERKT